MCETGKPDDLAGQAARPPRKRWAYGVWIAIAAGLAVGFRHYLRWMWHGWFTEWRREDLGLIDRFLEGDSYYTHGPLAPLISVGIFALLVKYVKIPIRPRRWAGLGLVVFSLLVYIMICVAQVRFLLGFVALAILTGLVVLLWGWGALRRVWFPIALLAFALPLSHVSIAQLSFKLRILATDWAVSLANLIGIAAERMNNTIFLTQDKSMVVGDVCSGLRTLISLLAFGAIYAYVCRLRGVWRVGLFLMAVPIGLLGNCVRITSIIAVAHVHTVEFATGPYHDSSGVLIFILAFALMFGLEKLILAVRKAVGRPAKVLPLYHDARRGAADEHQAARLLAASANRWGLIAAAVILLAAAFGDRLARRPRTMWDKALVDSSVPGSVTVAGRSYTARKEYLTTEVQRILRTNDYLYRRYSSPGCEPMRVLVVYSQDNRMTTHAPEVCIEAAGATIVSGGDTVLSGVAGRGDLACRQLLVHDSAGVTYYLYTLRAGDSYTNSIWRQQFRVFANALLGRDGSGALIRLSVRIDGGGAAAAQQKLQELMREVIPSLDSALRDSETEPAADRPWARRWVLARARQVR